MIKKWLKWFREWRELRAFRKKVARLKDKDPFIYK